MIRSTLLLLVLAAPAWAAPSAPRHVHESAEAAETPSPSPGAAAAQAPASSTFAKPFDPALTKKAEEAAVARDKAWDVKLKKTMGGVCRGC